MQRRAKGSEHSTGSECGSTKIAWYQSAVAALKLADIGKREK